MKRVLDLLLVLLAAPFWLPLLLLVALAVLCALGRPVFFTQERAGLGGRPFRIVKFRSMRNGPGTDAERLTRFGRFLREFAARTQFIVVTHRKGTMEAVDTMYGVTVEDAGVSRLLSVKLEEIEGQLDA